MGITAQAASEWAARSTDEDDHDDHDDDDDDDDWLSGE